MARYGITPDKVYGVSIPKLTEIAKEIGKDHFLAQRLWEAGIRETRILASMIDDPKFVTEAQMESWAKDFDCWEVCDQCCMKLFKKTEFAYGKAMEWSAHDEEFVKRAGFVLMSCLSISDKKADDKEFLRFLPIIDREATDDRTYVKKAVNWALRQIGKRSRALNEVAIKTAREIQQINSTSARWIASDAIRELTSEAVQKRLKR
jgi:3-methyladenine DNA glycosylase AlkD